MSFYNGSLDREKAIEFIKQTDKEIYYTRGLRYRNPTILDVPINKLNAIESIINESFITVREAADGIYISSYSANDML